MHPRPWHSHQFQHVRERHPGVPMTDEPTSTQLGRPCSSTRTGTFSDMPRERPRGLSRPIRRR